MNYHLNGLSAARGKKDMAKTYDALLRRLEETRPHEYIEGRNSAYSIPDMIDRGQDMMQAQAAGAADGSADGSGDSGGSDEVAGGIDREIDAADMSVDGAL